MKWFAAILSGICLSSSVMATTVWAPTDGDTGDLYFSTTTENTSIGLLAIFDNSDLNFSGSRFELLDYDSVKFTQTAGGYSVASMQHSGQTPFFLSDTYNFILGLSLDGGLTWSGDTNTIALGSNIHRVIFGSLEVIAIDVKAVPLPAAVWLFATAFLALIGFSRRRSAS